ncbi:hypothetical protein HMF8227_01168 [Saliniradius amylolyticus]|uniref:Endonuclease/exonuclease/phosphatase domain-containing protein n=1 Tax=Saliniradius amylolyticus TaxID=2183582 RepID=A0A2S2E226_9ALTE|nr:endonuclease/exonuclease/phosphatase family protein [Saliniradius amylolyticus]AWL11649.1 hypothetical protein HMF8227_01168 [Saliniradius amylolyticus]
MRYVLQGLFVLFCAALLSLSNWPVNDVTRPLLLSLLYFPRWPLALGLLLLLVVIAYRRPWWLTLFNTLLLALSLTVFLEIKLSASQAIASQRPAAVTILSLNMGGPTDTQKLQRMVETYDVDVMAFQETSEQEISGLFPAPWQTHCVSRLCTVSRWPLRYQGSGERNQALDGWGRFVAFYQLGADKPVQLANVHLETPRKALNHILRADVSHIDVMLNTNERQRQAQQVAHFLGSDTPGLAAGDFNMVRLSPLYSAELGHYNNSLALAGRGLAHTKLTSYHGVTIDHVIHNDKLQTHSAAVLENLGGDHNPIIARLTHTP